MGSTPSVTTSAGPSTVSPRSAWLIEQHKCPDPDPLRTGEEEYNWGLKPLLPAALQASVFDHVQTRSVRELVGLFAHCQLGWRISTLRTRYMAVRQPLPL